MTKLVLDISMSLDGYVTADHRTPDEPLGAGGEALHDWLLHGSEEDHAMLAEAGAGTGAVITGRRNYEDSIRWWGADGPSGDARLPVFVVSDGRPHELRRTACTCSATASRRLSRRRERRRATARCA